MAVAAGPSQGYSGLARREGDGPGRRVLAGPPLRARSAQQRGPNRDGGCPALIERLLAPAVLASPAGALPRLTLVWTAGRRRATRACGLQQSTQQQRRRTAAASRCPALCALHACSQCSQQSLSASARQQGRWRPAKRRRRPWRRRSRQWSRWRPPRRRRAEAGWRRRPRRPGAWPRWPGRPRPAREEEDGGGAGARDGRLLAPGREGGGQGGWVSCGVGVLLLCDVASSVCSHRAQNLLLAAVCN